MNTVEPLVSVIMPAYNAGHFIQKAINSVLSSTYQNIELLIADDASLDNTLKVITQFSDPRIKLFKNSSNCGYLKTWNILMKSAKGEFISFCDADDYISETKINEQLNFFKNNQEYSICGCSLNMLSDNGEIVGQKKFPSSWEEIQKKLLLEFNFPFCGSAVMIKREVYETIGGYRSFFDRLGWEDHDWLIRCCEKFKASNLSSIHYSYRNSFNSVTRSFSEKEMHKLQVKKIGIDVARYRASTNIDVIDNFDFWKLHEIVLLYEKKYIKHKDLLYFDLAMRNRGNEKRIFFLRKAIKTNPFNVKYYYHYLRSLF